MKDKIDRLNIRIPAALKKRVKLKALKDDMTMAEWVIKRLQIGLAVGK